MPRPMVLALSLGIATLGDLRPAHGVARPLSAAERAEITQVLRGFFEAVRDGRVPAATAAFPTPAEFSTLFVAGTTPFVTRHVRAIERDVRELRARFAGGVWLGLAAGFAPRAIEVSPCGRFGAPNSQCAAGPVIEWRATDGATQRLRVDRLVRVRGHWRVFDARL